MGAVVAILLILAGLGAFAWFFMKDDAPVVAAASTESASAETFAAPGQVTETVPQGTPVYDETYKVWTIDDPARGKLWHQEATDTWVPF